MTTPANPASVLGISSILLTLVLPPLADAAEQAIYEYGKFGSTGILEVRSVGDQQAEVVISTTANLTEGSCYFEFVATESVPGDLYWQDPGDSSCRISVSYGLDRAVVEVTDNAWVL